jgi:hypothetical protein
LYQVWVRSSSSPAMYESYRSTNVFTGAGGP